MKGRLQHWLPLAPLLLLMAGTYWLNMQVDSTGPGGNKNLRHDPDYIIDNFTATTLDEKGKIRFVMSAKKLWHYPDDDTTHLEQPRIESMTADYPPLRITALNGKLSSKGDEVFLHNDVVIFRPAYADKGEMTFKSNYLRVVPHKDIADTNQPVTMSNANTLLNAVGMELDNKTHTIKFLSRVKAVYEPPEK
ncbi:MAG: LPS export ABC transporter periplasmic protein LptC [Gallionellaceae bacterium]|jgi:lipopolysaccharide export system protein LptC